MADIYLHNGRTYLQVGTSYAIRAELICPECGARENSQTTSEEPPEEATDPEVGQIYREYEQNLGVLTPMIADQIDDLIEHYPRDWIPVAFREAVAHEARNLKYVGAILRRWSVEGFRSSHPPGGSRAQSRAPDRSRACPAISPEELLRQLEQP